jgi:hypothetical protein
MASSYELMYLHEATVLHRQQSSVRSLS